MAKISANVKCGSLRVGSLRGAFGGEANVYKTYIIFKPASSVHSDVWSDTMVMTALFSIAAVGKCQNRGSPLCAFHIALGQNPLLHTDDRKVLHASETPGFVRSSGHGIGSRHVSLAARAGRHGSFAARLPGNS
jgi:hypothetical protein